MIFSFLFYRITTILYVYTMHDLLSQYFGYQQFRPLQEEVISSFTNNNDTLVLMPTGGGKSICYQIPALMKKGTMLVISPLIALMKDQVDALNSMGIPATYLNSTLSPIEQSSVMQNAEAGDYKLLYIAPERLGNPNFIAWLKRINLSGIAVDEAHCISQWGHDFRPDYRNLRLFKSQFPNLPIIALTASATPKVQEDIVTSLNLNNAKIFQSSFYRKNLSLQIVPKRNMKHKIVQQCTANKDDATVIYCYSRKETESIAEMLEQEGVKAKAYHAGLPHEIRSAVQDAFLKDDIQVVTATIAFGMGVDKPNIRTIIHTNFPKTLEGYYQETGRAGRDGLDSKCLLMWSRGDTRKHEFFIDRLDNKEQADLERIKMNEVVEFCDQRICRWNQIITYFGETPSFEHCDNCDVCLASNAVFDATEITQKILSTVVRTENRFGKNHIIGVLRGSKAQSIIKWGHENLPVWGIEQQYSKNELSDIFENLVHKKILEKNDGEFATYKLSDSGLQWLKSKEKMFLPETEQEEEIISPKVNQVITFDKQVFIGLKALRKQIADAKNVPSFIIFNDATLQEIAHYLPQSIEGFGKISGIGAQKQEEFGEIFTAKIQKMTQMYNLSPKPIPENISKSSSTQAQKTKKSTKTGSSKQARIDKTQELLVKKYSVSKIAKALDVSDSTIYKYIIDILENTANTEIVAHLLPEIEQHKKIEDSFQKLGTERLKPVFEDLNSEFSYDDLKIVRVLLK